LTAETDADAIYLHVRGIGTDSLQQPLQSCFYLSMRSHKSRKKASSPPSPTAALQFQLEVLPPALLPRLTLLQNLYISRLDASLIASIAAESGSLDEARVVLEPLAKASVSEEEFQASLRYGDGPAKVAASSSSSEEAEYVKMEGLSEHEAFQFLRITFPKPTNEELKRVIKAAGGDVRKALDVMLNTEYLKGFEEKNTPSFGVSTTTYIEDDEDEDSIWAKRRPGNVSRPKTSPWFQTPTFPALEQSSSQKSPRNSRSQTPTRSQWDVLDSQILFLSQSLSLPSSRVRSAFHANSSSLPKTLRELLKKIPEDRTDEDIIANLRSSFKNVDVSLLRKIVSGTKHDIDTAMELCRILDHDKPYHSVRTITAPSSNIKFSINLTKPPAPEAQTQSGPRIVDHGEGTYEEIMELRKWYLEKRNERFTAASQAYKRSKSDAQLSGVAAYYASEGRDYDIKYRHYSAIAANRLVQENSRKNSLDLHGVGVRDALRIVEEGVTNWWSHVEVLRDRGEIKAVEKFVIITGRGDRYKSGGKLGPEVSRWLRKNGWGFEDEDGQIVVWGLRKAALWPKVDRV